MLSLKLICVGKMKEKFFTAAAEEYIKRLGAYCKIEIIEIPEEPVSGPASDKEIEKALMKEGAKILKALDGRSYITALCVEGENIESAALASKLSAMQMECPSAIFIIGGSNGLSEDIKKRAGLRLSMSRMTFPHHLARVMLLEQIYRAFKIQEGSDYHK